MLRYRVFYAWNQTLLKFCVQFFRGYTGFELSTLYRDTEHFMSETVHFSILRLLTEYFDALLRYRVFHA